MRVIGGEFRSRRLRSIPGLATRPTPDRLRETLFNVLAPRIVGAVFVDAYAGTGAVGIEALSRGAARCVFVDSGRRAVGAIRENLHVLGIEGRALVIPGKVVTILAGQPADIVFLDPPYEMEEEYGAALEQVQAFAARHGWRRVASHDTAGAVREVIDLGAPSVAAIGPALAAERYGGQVLACGIQDEKENYTRFVLIARS